MARSSLPARFLVLTTLVTMAPGLVACDGAEPANDGGTDAGENDDDEVDAGIPTDTYEAGMIKDGANGQLSVRLVSADPAPPNEGDNTFVLEVLDADGALIESGAIVTLRPWMPAHGHGTNPSTYDAVANGDGTHTVGPFDLIMPGVWELRIRVELPGQIEDVATFTFFAEG